MKLTDFKTGQTVYLLVIKGSNAYRWLRQADGTVNIEDRVIETVVTSVGKKFVKVDYGDKKFDSTDDFVEFSNFAKEYVIFLDKESAYNEIKADTLFTNIKNYFSAKYKNTLTLEQLENIADILGITDTDN